MTGSRLLMQIFRQFVRHRTTDTNLILERCEYTVFHVFDCTIHSINASEWPLSAVGQHYNITAMNCNEMFM